MQDREKPGHAIRVFAYIAIQRKQRNAESKNTGSVMNQVILVVKAAIGVKHPAKKGQKNQKKRPGQSSVFDGEIIIAERRLEFLA